MDNSWQVKCGSALQSSMPSMVSSTSQEPRNQVNSGNHFYPHVGNNLRSQVQRRTPDPTFPNIPNLSPYSSCHADVGNSFLALLSGPASLLHCDFQELSNPKPFAISDKLPTESSSIAVNAIGNWVPPMSSGLLSENVNYQNLQNGADFSLQSSDLAKAVIHHMVLGNERVKDFPSWRDEWCSRTPANTIKLQNTNIPLPPKMPLEVESAVSNNMPSSASGCPRVLCLGTSGDLLLSNTGLLGILCSCHCFNMSVSKFCEHAGLWNVNPGDGVRMDSGETIAQWRKLYFQKLGIRVPEDQSGWDWPEELSLTASLLKSGASVNIAKNFDCNYLVGPSGSLVRSGQPLDDLVFPKNPLADQNSVIDALQNKQQRNGQDGNKFRLKDLVGTPQTNSHGVGENRVNDCPVSRHLTIPNFVGSGSENGCQSISAYINNIVKTGSFSNSHPTLQNLRTHLTSSDLSRAKNWKDGVNLDKDAASSSIELRLGQPYQQSQSSRSPVLSVIGPELYNTLVDAQKPFSQEQIICNVNSCRGEQESRQYLPFPAGTSNFVARKEQGQLDYGDHAISDAMAVAKLEKLKGNIVDSSVLSTFKHLNTPPEGRLHAKIINNGVNMSKHIMPQTLHCESSTVKCDALGVPLNSGNGLERQWTVPELGFFRHADKGKGVGCLASNPYIEKFQGSKMHKRMENPSSFTGVVDMNSCSSFPAMHGKNHYSHHLSSPLNASVAGNLSDHLEKVSCFGNSGHINHVLLRSMGSQMNCGQVLPSQAVPSGFPSSTSTSIPELNPALLKQESFGVSPYLLDDNLRLLALRQILELSKQQREMSALGKNIERGRCGNPSNVKEQHSLVQPSTLVACMHGPNLTSQHNVSEVGLKSVRIGPVSKMSSDADKFTPVTGLDRTVAQGMPIWHKEIDMQCQLSHDPTENEQPLLRLGRSENNIAHSNEHEDCCQRTLFVRGNCSCAAHTKCLGGEYKLRDGNSPNSFRDQMGSVRGKAPKLCASQFVKNHTVPKETSSSLDQCKKLTVQLPNNFNCCTSQWKDVPSKNKGLCGDACVKQSGDILDGRRCEISQLEDSAAKCSNAAVHIADSLKEQEKSNISSGCSTQAITQASTEVNNMGSSNVITGNNRYVNNLIVDEGSAIDKCWSSDDALESDKSAEFNGSTCKTSLRKEGSTSRSLLDEVKLMDSFTWKKCRNQIRSAIVVRGTKNHGQDFERGLKTGKRKREMKLKLMDASLGTASPFVHDQYLMCDGTPKWSCLSKDVQMISVGLETSCPSGALSLKPSSKCGMSTLSLTKASSRKRDLHRLYNVRDGEDDHKTESNGTANSYTVFEVSGRKKFRSTGTSNGRTQSQPQEQIHAVGEKAVEYDSVSCMKASSSQQGNVCHRKERPVVCGKYGELSNDKMASGASKPVKIVSLDRILKTTKRCTLPKIRRPGLTLPMDLKRTSSGWNSACLDKFPNLKKDKVDGSNDALGYDKKNLHASVEERENASASEDRQSVEISMSDKERNDKTEKYCGIVGDNVHAQSKLKLKEIRRRSLYELTSEGKSPSCKMLLRKKIFKSKTKMKRKKLLKNSEDTKRKIRGLHKVNAKRRVQEQKHLPMTDSDSFCCVCGSSNKDEVNCLLECGRCLIRVHQACYGVSKVPKGHWYCRPCKTSSTNIVCVLCGYGGGAMTRALRSSTIVKSLLKAWNLETEYGPKNVISSAEPLQDELSLLRSSGSALENNAYPVLTPANIEPSTSAVWGMDMQNQLDVLPNSFCCVSNLKAHNSITAGILGSTVKQWVHMVCGLWTPGTRCPNVDTMSAFDVSGVSCPKAHGVCSICNRPGGSCIQCRVVNCSVQFHPWCAHRKGLLQSEIEGVDNENVGFYGRCVLHDRYPANASACDANNIETGCPEDKEASCARTEGYKGRKRDGFWHNVNGRSKGKGGCLVPQEQLNAWIHINGQKPCTQGLLKLPMSNMEYDCRKEYARYKQAKGWKHLVVYKSGIHALGLYTSRFISRGEMVVEYVGEIVGLRVADKRENEYQSGRKLQYKSACYFFRIDKEHIIDATLEGGIARFVNHSCLPNCVAKVISVRNEKKVVFFAERDIYPGEEITYDYHFNHEDEGKKIPCFCNAKNCRRYLN